jgi:hypothetical protein
MIPAGYMAKRVQKPKGLQIDGIADIRTVAEAHSIQLDGSYLFYYEVYEMEFDGKIWSPYEAEASLPTNVIPPEEKVLEGFDVVTFYAKNAPECSPLSCKGMAEFRLSDSKRI